MKSSDFRQDLDSATLDTAWQGIRTRRVAARRKRQALLAVPVVAAAAMALFLVFGRTPATKAMAPHVLALVTGDALPAEWSAEKSPRVDFDDGSHLELAPTTHLHPLGTQHDPARVDLALESGNATFDIRPGGPRAWTIEAGDTRVRVLGTRFTVARTDNHVHVSVERGKVRVESARLAGGGRDLTAGQEVDVSDAKPAPEAPASPVTVMPVGELPAASAPSMRAVPAGPSPTQASSSPKPIATAAAAKPADRMARADAARAAGEPKEALAILASVVDDHDPTAPLAAFTMGKIHSETLGDPMNGAVWFERAIRLGLPAGLDEDAHARVVECYGAAGRADDAAHAAAKYEAMFPSGRHLPRVRRWKE